MLYIDIRYKRNYRSSISFCVVEQLATNICFEHLQQGQGSPHNRPPLCPGDSHPPSPRGSAWPGHPPPDTSWSGPNLRVQILNMKRAQVAKSGELVETLGSTQVMQEKIPVAGLRLVQLLILANHRPATGHFSCIT